MDTRHCKGCERDLPLDAFYNKQVRCKPCHVEYTGAYYARLTPEARAKRIATVKARKYGMTLDEMRALVEAHDDNCDLCGKPDTTHRKATWTRKLTFDHDHTTGKLRGLLCSSCNLAIGHAGDDPDLLERMAAHIRRFR